MSNTKIVTGEARLAYAKIWEPESTPEGNLKYSVCVMIPKKDKRTIDAIRDGIKAATELGVVSKWNGKKAGIKVIELRDGDEVDEDGARLKGEEFRGMMYINASAHRQPIILDRSRNEVLDRAEVYSGCWANVCINFYPYANTAANAKGVSAGLEVIRKTKDDDSLMGGVTLASAREMFDELEDDGQI